MTAGELFEILKGVSRDAEVQVSSSEFRCLVPVKSACQSEDWGVPVFVIDTDE